MHGTPITVTAQQEGKTPEEVAMEYHNLNSDSIERMGISFDLFSHTHTEEHAEVALSILKKLDDNGYYLSRVGLSVSSSHCFLLISWSLEAFNIF